MKLTDFEGKEVEILEIEIIKYKKKNRKFIILVWRGLGIIMLVKKDC